MPRFVVPSLRLAEPAFGEAVDLLVVRQDQVGVAAQLEPGAVDALRGRACRSRQQHRRVDDDAVADHGSDVVVQDSAGHQLESEGLTVDDDGVTRVVAALIADDQMHLLGDEIGELALALVAPLGADDDRRGHGASFKGRRNWASLSATVPLVRHHARRPTNHNPHWSIPDSHVCTCYRHVCNVVVIFPRAADRTGSGCRSDSPTRLETTVTRSCKPALALASVVMLATVLTACRPAPPPLGGSRMSTAHGTLPAKRGVYIGTYSRPSGSGRAAEQASVAAQERFLGRKLDIVHWFYSWSSTFPTWRESANLASGRIPMISWGPTNTRSIVNGSQDRLIRGACRWRPQARPAGLDALVLGDGRKHQRGQSNRSWRVQGGVESHCEDLPSTGCEQRLVRLVPQRLGSGHQPGSAVVSRSEHRRLDLRRRLQLVSEEAGSRWTSFEKRSTPGTRGHRPRASR